MEVWYMNGAGNDFVVLDVRGKKMNLQELAVQLCQAFCADGLMALDVSEKADFKLHFYNADGLRGEMCGNGARCICRYAYEKGLAGDTMVVETDAGLVYGWRLSETQYRVRLNLPGVLDLERKPGIAYVELGDPGVPHAVLEVPGLLWEQKEELREMARELRYDEAFPKGANVNFYTWIGPGEVRLLTYERGVEDYTLACGTGSASVAVVLWTRGDRTEGDLTVHNPGGTLKVSLKVAERLEAVYLDGPTEIVDKACLNGKTKL